MPKIIKNHLLIWLVAAYFLVLAVFSIFSYSLTDPNLVLINNPIFWSFQQWMWQNIFANKQLLGSLYLVFAVALFAIFILLITSLKKSKPKWSSLDQILFYLLLIFPLFLSYNALSHDVFNYIFNARMVIEYGADPHVSNALQFSGDPWLRFMHNTHTSAPYGRGWTYLSLIPYIIGSGKFILTWLSFRLMAITSILLTYFSLRYFSRILLKRELDIFQAALLFLNPLLLIEVVVNQHNDLWMLLFAISGIALYSAGLFEAKKVKLSKLILGLTLFAFSVYLKLATLVLIPVLLLLFSLKIAELLLEKSLFKAKAASIVPHINKFITKARQVLFSIVPDISAILLFIPLMTERSQQFHPWYLLWVLAWVPVMRSRWLKRVILVFSFFSLLRYIPWLMEGGYNADVLYRQKLITWLVPLMFAASTLHSAFRRKKNARLPEEATLIE